MTLDTRQEPVRLDNMQANRGGNNAGIAMGIAIAIALAVFVIFYGSSQGGETSRSNLSQPVGGHNNDMSAALPNFNKSASKPH